MLDTDISSYLIKENSAALAEKLRSCKNDPICISSVTYAELMFGALKKHTSGNEVPSKLNTRIRNFVSLVHIIDFNAAAAEEYAQIRVLLEAQGTPIGNADMFIAACAKSVSAILVTNNEKHFLKISGLTVENWAQ